MQIHELNTLDRKPKITDYLAIDTGFDTAKISADDLLKYNVNSPVDSAGNPDNGVAGQLLRSKGDGSTEWTDVGQPTDAQTAQAVSDWLDAHPEATTTVQDDSLTEAKFTNDLRLKTIKDYVTPEMFGAVGDGTTDDSTAIQSAVDNTNGVVVFSKKYLCSNIDISSPVSLIFINGSSIELKYYDASKQLFRNVFNIMADTIIDGVKITGDYIDTTVSQTNYTEPLFLVDGSHLILKNALIKDLKIKNRGSSPGAYSARRGIVLTAINGGDFIVDNCILDNLNNEEWIQCLGTNYTGDFIFKNSKFLNGTGFSRITVEGNSISIIGCEFSKAIYAGSLCNTFANLVKIENNYIHDCSIQYLFDCTEGGDFTSKNVIAKNNYVDNLSDTSATTGHLVVVNGGNVFLEGNTYCGKGFLRFINVAPTYGTLEANSIIAVRNNTILYRTLYINDFAIPLRIASNIVTCDLYVDGNTILSSADSLNIYPPIILADVNKAYISNNTLFLGKGIGTGAKILEAINMSRGNECYASNNILKYIVTIGLADYIAGDSWASTYIARYISEPVAPKKLNAYNLVEVQGTFQDANGQYNISI